MTTTIRQLLTLALLICSSFLPAQSIHDGVLDLRNTNGEFPNIELKGKWFFYWNELQSPETSVFKKEHLVDFPVIWNNLDQTKYTSSGYATYKLVVLPGKTKNLAIYTPAVYNSYRLFINNNEISQNGIVGSSKESSMPHWRQTTSIIDNSILLDSTIITLQISNFRHAKGGPVDNLILGNAENLLTQQKYIFTIDSILTGALIMGGLFFLGLFLFGRRQKNILYFSLFCIVFSYNVFGSNNYILHDIFPYLPWEVTTRLEYIVIYLSAILLIKYTYKTYPKEGIPYLDQITLGISSIYILITAALPSKIFTATHLFFMYFMIVLVLAGYYIYFKAFINNRTGAKVAFISTSIMLSAIVVRTLDVMDIIDPPLFIVPLAYMFFFFLQSVTTSQQVALSWEKASIEAEQALQAKSDFLSTMSHEIRTPMNAVIGLTHQLLDGHPRQDQKETLNTLKFSSENLLRLINDILDFSKLEAGNLILEESLFNLEETGANLVSGFQSVGKEKGTLVILDYDKTLPKYFIGDAGRLTQVLSNLINNAVKFTENGRVTLKVEETNRHPETIEITFSVEDTGIGISQFDKQKVFEKFNQANTSVTRKYGGTGLGLTITKKILELQNVQIHLDSELGKGSTFYFTLNLKIAKGYRKEVSKPSELKDPLKGKNILLVDDNAVNIMVAKRFLEKWHCVVTTANNGYQALEKLDVENTELILMDLQMPEMDGYETTRRIREMGLKIPILALTAAALTDLEKNITEAGLNDFVIKPFHPDHLYQKLISHLENNNQPK